MSFAERIANLAAEIRRSDKCDVQTAIGRALNFKGVTDPQSRTLLFSESARILGSRGGMKTAIKRKQRSFNFGPV